MGQSQEGIEVDDATLAADEGDEETPRHHGEFDLLSPPGTTGLFSDNLEGIAIEGRISQPANSIGNEPIARRHYRVVAGGDIGLWTWSGAEENERGAKVGGEVIRLGKMDEGDAQLLEDSLGSSSNLDASRVGPVLEGQVGMAQASEGGQGEAEESQGVEEPAKVSPLGQSGLYILGDWQGAARMVQAGDDSLGEEDDAENVEGHQCHTRVVYC